MTTNADREAAAKAVKAYLNSPAAHDLYWSVEYGRDHDNAINLAIVDTVIAALTRCTRETSTSSLSAENQRLREALKEIFEFCDKRLKGTDDWFDLTEIRLAAGDALSTPSEVSNPVAGGAVTEADAARFLERAFSEWSPAPDISAYDVEAVRVELDLFARQRDACASVLSAEAEYWKATAASERGRASELSAANQKLRDALEALKLRHGWCVYHCRACSAARAALESHGDAA